MPTLHYARSSQLTSISAVGQTSNLLPRAHNYVSKRRGGGREANYVIAYRLGQNQQRATG